MLEAAQAAYSIKTPTGPSYNEFQVGAIDDLRPRRAVREPRSIGFALLAMNPYSLGFDGGYLAYSELKLLIVNS